jgi:hypothetical protein
MEVLKFYKRERGEGRRGSVVSITLHSQICDLTDYLWGVGISSSDRSGSSALQGELGARRTNWILCGPFATRGAKGEAEYP